MLSDTTLAAAALPPAPVPDATARAFCGASQSRRPALLLIFPPRQAHWRLACPSRPRNGAVRGDVDSWSRGHRASPFGRKNEAQADCAGRHAVWFDAGLSDDVHVFVFDVIADHGCKRMIAGEPEVLRARRVPPRRPTADDRLDARIRLPFDALHDALARHLA